MESAPCVPMLHVKTDRNPFEELVSAEPDMKIVARYAAETKHRMDRYEWVRRNGANNGSINNGSTDNGATNKLTAHAPTANRG